MKKTKEIGTFLLGVIGATLMWGFLSLCPSANEIPVPIPIISHIGERAGYEAWAIIEIGDEKYFAHIKEPHPTSWKDKNGKRVPGSSWSGQTQRSLIDIYAAWKSKKLAENILDK